MWLKRYNIKIMKVKNIKHTANQDKTKSNEPLVEIARQVVNQKAGHIILTKQDVKEKVGAHTINGKKVKGISITTPANNNPNNTSTYGVKYFVPMNEIKKMDNKLAKKK